MPIEPSPKVIYRCRKCGTKQAWWSNYGETQEELEARLDESYPCPVYSCEGRAYPDN